MDNDHHDTRAQFLDAVNLTGRELERWLDTEESRSVGMSKDHEKKSDPGGQESVGHESGRRILALLHTDDADLTDADYAHMHKVVGYVHRHVAQKPTQKPDKEPLANSRWRHSLMNSGHDPLKT